ncbi:MAG: hypothetical protein QHI38_10915 [Armatimonadota bacterium]|nr:hypothetical protein [Armatimonadota bacterium]
MMKTAARCVLALLVGVLFSASAVWSAESGICAKVRVRLSQDVALTRAAFKATLEITNAPENVALENVKVTLDIRNEAGEDATNLFGIRPPELTGISNVDGQGRIPPGTTVQAVWIIIPTRDAAPDVPTRYTVGGTLSYTQEGEQINMPLFPAPILVKPDPLLCLDYFWVRYVYADDARTPEIEPSEPFPLGLIVRNDGKGIAYNMRITSSQPQIVENEKGLAITFQIISSQVNDQEVSPSLTVNLGDIQPAGTAVARWYMTSTLAGTFSEYSATFEHIDELGDKRLSLIDEVRIHELNHCVRIDVPEDDKKPDFLVNDIPDEDHLPDRVYNSNGTNSDVVAVTNAMIHGGLGFGSLSVQLVATCPAGWVYIEAEDPGQELYNLVRVVRDDGREILVGDNAWTTHRTTCPEGQGCIRVHKVHIFDYDSTGVYTLYYEPKASPSSYSLDEVKGLRDGEWVELGCTEGLVVTAVFPEAFYVERPDRTVGIRVSKKGSVVPGMQVAITGQVATTPWLERYISATSVQVCSNELVTIEPVGVTTRSLGGGSFMYDLLTGAGQRATQAYQWVKQGSEFARSEVPVDVPGLNNIGLLVRTWGKVVWSDPSTSTFYLDNSGGFDDFRFPDPAKNQPPGVRVVMPSWGMPVPPVGSTVAVTGISTCYTEGGYVFRKLRVRSEADVQVIGQ